MKKYLPVEWTDDAPGQAGTLINKERLDRMQTQYLNAAGIQVLDTLPSVPNGNENICIVNNVLYVYTDKWTSFASLASDGRIVGSGNRSGLSTTGALVTDQPNAQNVSPSYGFISFLNANQAIFTDEPSTVRCGGISIYNEAQTAVIQMVISSQSRKIAIRNATSASTWSAWEVHGGAVNWSSIVSKPVAFPPAVHEHAWSELSDKPSTFPPETHEHDYIPLEQKGVSGGVPSVDTSGRIALNNNYTMLKISGVQLSGITSNPMSAGIAGGASFINAVGSGIFPNIPSGWVSGISVAGSFTDAIQIVTPTGVTDSKLAVRTAASASAWNPWKIIPNEDNVQSMINTSIANLATKAYVDSAIDTAITSAIQGPY